MDPMRIAPTCCECHEAKYDCRVHQGHLYCAECIERGEQVHACARCGALSDEEPYVIETEDGAFWYCYYCHGEEQSRMSAFERGNDENLI